MIWLLFWHHNFVCFLAFLAQFSYDFSIWCHIKSCDDSSDISNWWSDSWFRTWYDPFWCHSHVISQISWYFFLGILSLKSTMWKMYVATLPPSILTLLGILLFYTWLETNQFQSSLEDRLWVLGLEVLIILAWTPLISSSNCCFSENQFFGPVVKVVPPQTKQCSPNICGIFGGSLLASLTCRRNFYGPWSELSSYHV